LRTSVAVGFQLLLRTGLTVQASRCNLVWGEHLGGVLLHRLLHRDESDVAVLCSHGCKVGSALLLALQRLLPHALRRGERPCDECLVDRIVALAALRRLLPRRFHSKGCQRIVGWQRLVGGEMLWLSKSENFKDTKNVPLFVRAAGAKSFGRPC